jgi:hypothetical protein
VAKQASPTSVLGKDKINCYLKYGFNSPFCIYGGKLKISTSNVSFCLEDSLQTFYYKRGSAAVIRIVTSTVLCLFLVCINRYAHTHSVSRLLSY